MRHPNGRLPQAIAVCWRVAIRPKPSLIRSKKIALWILDALGEVGWI